MRKIEPNSRSNKFFCEDEFELEIEMGREWFEGDNNLEVVLYKVNSSQTETTDIYNETPIGMIVTYTPITLKVYPILTESKNVALSGITGRHSTDGEFSFIIYTKQLTEQNTSITFGDFIGLRVSETELRYFEVCDDDYLNFANNRTILGYRSFYKTIKCKAVQKDKFNGI